MPAPRPAVRAEPRLSLADWRHAERLFHGRRESAVAVEQPLVLISQIQRSGGTLMSSLLDGHAQLHVHPWELQIGDPSKAEWPLLDPALGADELLERLAQPWLPRVFESGYRKDDRLGAADADAIPMTIVPSLVEGLFRVLIAESPAEDARGVLDRYFTALFNSWLDYQGLREGPKRLVVGFCPRLAWGDSRARWAADYPDGRLITIPRDPRGWYASARRQNPDGRYDDRRAALAEWRHGAEEIIAAKEERPDRVFVVTYERLVSEPEPVMRAVASWLGVDWHDALLEPTFNRLPVVANSSFAVPAGGVRSEPLARWREELDAETRAAIEETALPLYESVREIADQR